MDTRTSILVVGLYLAVAAVIGLIGWGYYTVERRGVTGVVADRSGPSGAPDLSARGPASTPARAPYYQASRAKSDESLRQLRASLAESQRLLEQRYQALNQKTAECQALKSDLDHSFMLILNLLAQQAAGPVSENDSAVRVRHELQSELARLTEALHQAETLGAEQGQQLAQLRGDLLQADTELEMLREQADLEIASLLEERAAFETVIAKMLARFGAEAVPVVADRLEDERVEVRRWAARALGALGPDAHQAAAALRRSLSDPDVRVRQEAEKSLRVLDGETARAAAPR